MYRAHLTRSTLRRTECEIVAVKTIKGENVIGHGVHCCPQLLPTSHICVTDLFYCSVSSSYRIHAINFFFSKTDVSLRLL